MFPLRTPAGTGEILLSIYGVEGLDHMDVFVFTGDGFEVDSTVSSDLFDSLPAGTGYSPTTQENPHTVSINDEFTSRPCRYPQRCGSSSPTAVRTPWGSAQFHLDVTA